MALNISCIGTDASRVQARGIVRDNIAVEKLFTDFAERYRYAQSVFVRLSIFLSHFMLSVAIVMGVILES